jgi:hypothetical protein
VLAHDLDHGFPVDEQAIAERLAVDDDFELHSDGIALVILDHDGGGAVAREELLHLGNSLVNRFVGNL